MEVFFSKFDLIVNCVPIFSEVTYLSVQFLLINGRTITNQLEVEKLDILRKKVVHIISTHCHTRHY